MPHTHVVVGRYSLTVGAAGGTRITPQDTPPASSTELARALRRPPPSRSDDATDALEVMTALADGSLLTVEEIVPRLAQILGVLERLDRAGRHEEALRLARAVVGPLLLAQRWVELVQALDAALRSARHLGDASAIAWAQHELGTLYLAAGDVAGADPRLAQALEIRERLGEHDTLAATQHNLTVLRRHPRPDVPPRRTPPAIVLACALALVLAAAAAAIVLPDQQPQASGSDSGGGPILEPPATSVRKDPRLSIKIRGQGSVTSESGEIECTRSCRHRLPRGDEVSLVAHADASHRFVGWKGRCAGENPCSLTIRKSTTVTATFELKPPTVNQPPGECQDGRDNDGDGLVDANDPGCADGKQTEEPFNPRRDCRDGKDNDGDGYIDGQDPRCRSGAFEAPRDPSARTECQDHRDNDGDGLVDGGDPGCADERTEAPFNAPRECRDHQDNDGDGYVDAKDPGCADGDELPRDPSPVE